MNRKPEAGDRREASRVSRRGFAGSLMAGLALMAAGIKGRLKLGEKADLKEADYYERMDQVRGDER